MKGAHVALHDIIMLNVEGKAAGYVGKNNVCWGQINARMAKNNPWTSWHGMGEQDMGRSPSVQTSTQLQQFQGRVIY